MITLYVDIGTRTDGKSLSLYGDLYYLDEAPCEDCCCDDPCGGPAKVFVSEPTEPIRGATIYDILLEAVKVAEAKGFDPENSWKLGHDNTFTCKARPPLPKALNKNTVLSALRELGLDVSDSGSVAFTFSSGRATVVRKLGEAPYRIDIKGKL